LTTLTLTIADETLMLYPERAVFWERTATLLVADLHWGKDAAFRAGAIPVPAGSLMDDLIRLDTALARQPVQRLMILGDLLHARESLSSDVIERVAGWRETWKDVEILLVRGNHDRHVRALPETWNIIEIQGEYQSTPFVLRHIPAPSETGYVLAGHLHPAVEMRGKGRQIVRVPCFWFGSQMGVLPAFGTFTGVSVVYPRSGEHVVGVINQTLLDLKAEES
jgi:DNA ligase-associated metallophosphoesterase